MLNTTAARVCFGFKRIVWGLLLFVFICFFSVASAEALGSFSGRVWNDLNNDGLMDDSEPGVGGVTLFLRRADTKEILTAVSDETGAYRFDSLPNDSYTFSVDVPQSMLFAPL